MPNKYTWSNVSGQNEQNIASSRLAGEVRARLGATSLSLSAARDAALAELLAETVGGAVEFDAGTVGAPAIYLNADTDTGIYWIGANNLGVAAAGAKVLDISTAGLQVAGTLLVSDTATFANDLVAIDLRRNTSDGSDNSKLRLCGGGAISNARGARLEVHGNESATPGALVLASGNVTGGTITIEIVGTTRGTINEAGLFAWTGDFSVGGTFTLAGATVSLGAADSGGAGFKVLRVPN